MERAISAIGILVFLGISYALSVNRSAIRWRTIAWGLGLEFTFALLMGRLSASRRIIRYKDHS